MTVLLALGCNRYELFLVDRGRDAVANEADVLFVIDNSDSMYEESVALAENFGQFVKRLTEREEGYGTKGLPDAVDRYVDYVQDPGYFVDFQLAITSIDAEANAGALLGDPPILRKGDPDLEQSFVRTLMCEATCFANRELVVGDETVTCDQPWNGEVTRQYLDCLCGVDAWVGNCGGGKEEGLEATLDAMCRAAPEPPEMCFVPWEEARMSPDTAHTSDGLLREGATFVPVVVTDEGDSSHRTDTTDPLPDTYAQIFAEFETEMAWAVIGPALDEEFEPVCSGLVQSWGVLRYEYMIQQTGGLKIDINAADCGPADWADALERVGDLVGGGVSAFRLASEPIPGSIAVKVGRRTIDEAREVGSDAFGLPLYSDGWSYREDEVMVLLHGEAVPVPGEEVRIWYWPKKGR